MSSISSKGGAEGVISPSVSDEDGFAKLESALDESHSSESEEEEEFELLESDVSRPLLLPSTSNGAGSSDSASDDSEPSVSAFDGSETSVPVSDGPKSPVSGSEESESLDSEESVSLSLSVEPGEN
jgi:hypothetical protein